MIESFASEFGANLDMPWQVWLSRLLGAAVFCGLIGFEREIDRQPAGLRTHILIGLAAATYCIMTMHIVRSVDFNDDQVRTDPVRVIEAVTQGVAFLAAGLVVFARGRVRGLTTGTTMWLSAAVGVACGLGLWMLALAVTAIAVAVITLIRLLEKKTGTYDGGHQPPEQQ
ncbi:MAG: MgtC/SapB family protein [Burkholderiaceae bacterium]